MKGVERRITDLEASLQIGDPGECQCQGAGPGTGWRCLAGSDKEGWHPDEWRGLSGDGDLNETCLVCGKERPLVRIEYVDNWQPTDEETEE